jgi:hypothetical protein
VDVAQRIRINPCKKNVSTVERSSADIPSRVTCVSTARSAHPHDDKLLQEEEEFSIWGRQFGKSHSCGRERVWKEKILRFHSRACWHRTQSLVCRRKIYTRALREPRRKNEPSNNFRNFLIQTFLEEEGIFHISEGCFD